MRIGQHRLVLAVAGCIIFDIVCGAPKNDNFGYFWQVTDFHYDANYSTHGNPSSMCHYSPSAVHYELGDYGDYMCDSPWSLIQSAVKAMKDLHSTPDFVIWTGDSIPHVNDSTLDKGKVVDIIHNVTEELISAFPNTSIFPSFGNHDPYPTNQMPIDDRDYYLSILESSRWDQLLPAGSNTTFLKGGYYSVELSKKLRLLCLNTALYYHTNNITLLTDAYDPSGQLSWLASQLEDAKLAHQRVYIAAHVPPGVFELSPRFQWFHADLNTEYLEVIADYGEVIEAQFYGHEHTDSFRIFGSSSSMFLSPAVTPWKSSLPGVGYNNPSLRLYKYDKTTSNVLDYYQYYLNLTAANSKQGSKWNLEYQFTKAYDVPDLKPKSVRQAAQHILERKTDNKYLRRYLKYNTVSAYLNTSCDERCRQNHRCAIFNLRYEQVDKCLNQDPSHHHHTTTHPNHHHRPPPKFPRYMTWIIIALAVGLVLLTIAVLVLCFRPRQHVIISRGYGRIVGGYGSTSSTSTPPEEETTSSDKS